MEMAKAMATVKATTMDLAEAQDLARRQPA